MDYKRNLKYFEGTNLMPGIVLIVIGLIMMAAGGAGVTFLGILLAGGGGYLLYAQFTGGPTDAEIDAAAKSAMKDLESKALQKMGLDRDEVTLIEPIVIGGPYFNALGGTFRLAMGKDKVVRSSNYEGVVIFFSEHQLHAYKFQFSLINDGERREQTDEYFYRDVVSISTQSETENVSVNQKSQTVNYEVFKLTTSGGTSITSAMRDTAGGGTRSIQGARQLIRDRKMSAGS